MIPAPELWESYQQSHLVVKKQELVNKMSSFALQSISFIIQRGF
jgi:hypothetical protein